MTTETETVPATVERSHRSAIRAKRMPNGDRISVSRQDGHCRIFIPWDSNLSIGENWANAIQQFLDVWEWSGVWVIGGADDSAVAVWKGDK